MSHTHIRSLLGILFQAQFSVTTSLKVVNLKGSYEIEILKFNTQKECYLIITSVLKKNGVKQQNVECGKYMTII